MFTIVEFRQHTPTKLAVEGEGKSWWCIRIGFRNWRLVPGSPPPRFGWWSQEAHGQSAPMPFTMTVPPSMMKSSGATLPVMNAADDACSARARRPTEKS